MLRAVGVFSSQERIKYLSLLCAAPELQGETRTQTSTFFQDPPEIVIAPSFDLNEPFHGSGLLTSVDLSHPIFGERNIPIYLPPGYLNPYKRFPVTFVIDASLKYMEVLKPQFGKILTTYITKQIDFQNILG